MYETEADIDFDDPASLFKYRAFDRYALQSLIDDEVWLAAPKTFNDPLDCKFQVAKQSTDEELLEHVDACAIARHDARRFTVDDVAKLRTISMTFWQS
jgi:hypothetical protein